MNSEYKYIPLGTPFTPKIFCDAALELVEHDEIIRALQLLENIPAYYRDNPPKEISDLKKLIRSKIYTIYDIQNHQFDLPSSHEKDNMKLVLDYYVRGKMLKDVVIKLNNEKTTPHIVDLGPGPYYFPYALRQNNLEFTYESKNINKKAEDQARELMPEIFKDPKPEQPIIFFACEIIEHLFNENDIRYVFDNIQAKYKTPQFIILSTPNYTYHPGGNDWKKDGLSHLRAYTPREFSIKIQDMFPEYDLSVGIETIITIAGTLKVDTK